MALERQVTFWVAALAVFVAVLWLLSDVLLPFVAGMALAYLLDPIARRGERLGIGRAVSALIVLTLVIVAVVVAVMVVAPIISEQFTAFVDNLPGYLTKLQSIVADPSRPWLAKIFGGGNLSDPGKSDSGLVTQASGYIGTFLASVWSGGRAVFSVLSLLIITPVVAFYLLVDWEKVVATIDGWIPLHHRDTVHGLAHDIDAAIAGFVRGQAVICLILAAFYAIGLTLTGLNFGFLIGLMTGLLSFIPFRRRGHRVSRCRGRRDRAVLAGLDVDCDGGRRVPGRSGARRLRAVAQAGRPQGRAASGLDDVCAVRVRLSVRLRRASGRHSACGDDRRAASLCAPQISRKPDLHRRSTDLGRADPCRARAPS